MAVHRFQETAPLMIQYNQLTSLHIQA